MKNIIKYLNDCLPFCEIKPFIQAQFILGLFSLMNIFRFYLNEFQLKFIIINYPININICKISKSFCSLSVFIKIS